MRMPLRVETVTLEVNRAPISWTCCASNCCSATPSKSDANNLTILPPWISVLQETAQRVLERIGARRWPSGKTAKAGSPGGTDRASTQTGLSAPSLAVAIMPAVSSIGHPGASSGGLVFKPIVYAAALESAFRRGEPSSPLSPVWRMCQQRSPQWSTLVSPELRRPLPGLGRPAHALEQSLKWRPSNLRARWV